jgi:hypothetical protein
MTMDSAPQIRAGLKPLAHDPRDLSLGGAFGVLDLSDVPGTDFLVAEPRFWKDQGASDLCTGYVVTSIAEDQGDGEELSPAFQFAASCRVRGTWGEWGCDLRTAFLAPVKFGMLRASDVPEALRDADRDFFANWENWPAEAFAKAAQRRQGSFFSVDGPYDLFDDVRAARGRPRADRATVGVGALWKDTWSRSPGGVLPKAPLEGGFGHALKIYGQKVIDGELHLVAQLSNGPIGDRGRFYIPREVFNRDFAPYGQFMLKGVPARAAQKRQAAGVTAGDGFGARLWKRISHLMRQR